MPEICLRLGEQISPGQGYILPLWMGGAGDARLHVGFLPRERLKSGSSRKSDADAPSCQKTPGFFFLTAAPLDMQYMHQHSPYFQSQIIVI